MENATLVGPSTKEFDVIINATGALPFLDWCGKGVAYDMSYGVEPTPFLGQASAHGWATYDGRLMLLHQAICSFRHWFKDPAPVDAMREGLP